MNRCLRYTIKRLATLSLFADCLSEIAVATQVDEADLHTNPKSSYRVESLGAWRKGHSSDDNLTGRIAF
jgi:hypothetical protein